MEITQLCIDIQKDIDDIKIELRETKEENMKIKQELYEIKQKLCNTNISKCSDELKNNVIEIIVKQYKKSILIISKHKDKNTTKPYRSNFKDELDAKWFTNQTEGQGWLFVGKYDENKTKEENIIFLIEYFEAKNIKLEITY